MITIKIPFMINIRKNPDIDYLNKDIQKNHLALHTLLESYDIDQLFFLFDNSNSKWIQNPQVINEDDDYVEFFACFELEDEDATQYKLLFS